MRLHGKPEIWRLHPKRFSDPSDLRSHSALVLKGEKVLDNRIAKNHVNAVVTKFREIRRVTRERMNVRMLLFFRDEVQSQNLDINALVPATIFPKRICTAYVENAHGPR
jgi:hypothetical protein